LLFMHERMEVAQGEREAETRLPLLQLF
jgi:hypothetical protein